MMFSKNFTCNILSPETAVVQSQRLVEVDVIVKVTMTMKLLFNSFGDISNKPLGGLQLA